MLLFGWLLIGCTLPVGPCATCFVDVDPPSEMERFTLIDADPGRSEVAGGYVLLTQLDDREVSFVTVIDGAGEPVWWVANDDPEHKHMRARMSRDRTAILVGTRDKDNNVDRGEIRRFDLRTGEITSTRAIDHHHDFVELPDGSLTYLSRDRVPDSWFGGKFPLAVDVVRTAELGSEDATEHGEVLHLLDDLDLTPFVTCSHFPETEFLRGFLDYTHSNSLVYDDETGDYTLGIRHLDTVLRFDGDGEVKWALGGRLGTMTPEGTFVSLRHAHFSDAWSDGILAFDNRNHDRVNKTRVVELAIDEAAGTFREVWSIRHPEQDFFAARGDARRLPGGNTLIAWTGRGEIWEVTSEGDVVWAARTAHRVTRLEFVPAWPPPEL